MRSLAIKLRAVAAAAAVLSLAVALCGCSMLERSWSSVQPHSATYWENRDTDTLRAESYQELVNALLMLVGDHSESGVVRVYGVNSAEWNGMAERACSEVQQETPIGAYLLEYITFSETTEKDYREVSVSFGYRCSAEEQAALIHATTVEAIPDLLRAAVQEGKPSIAVQLGDFSADAQSFADMVAAVAEESGTETPWQIEYYPNAEAPGIVEIVLE